MSVLNNKDVRQKEEAKWMSYRIMIEKQLISSGQNKLLRIVQNELVEIGPNTFKA